MSAPLHARCPRARVKIAIDDPATSLPGPPADVGASDFTLEFWMRVSGAGTGDRTICGTTSVLDGQWHHVAVQRRRSDGWMWLFVDGVLQAQADGPDGDISYPVDGVPGDFCGGACTNSDPFLVIGAEKHDAGASYPSYSGLVDAVRLSNVLRYGGSFTRPAQGFVADPATAALYHLDEGSGDAVNDTSGASGGPSPGLRRFGGSPAPGPVWAQDAAPLAALPSLQTVPYAVVSRVYRPLVRATVLDRHHGLPRLRRRRLHSRARGLRRGRARRHRRLSLRDGNVVHPAVAQRSTFSVGFGGTGFAPVNE